MPSHRNIPLADRLWAKVAKQPEPDGCWLWAGTTNKRGYGFIGSNGRLLGAHRAAWIVTHGPIPDGMWVLHRCDNPSCCRPDHLFLGTPRDNTADMIAKGRRRHWSESGGNPTPRGERHWTKRRPEAIVRGSGHPFAILTPDQVRDIRARIVAGRESQRAIARSYGVCPNVVSSIKLGKTYTDVD